MSFLQRARRVVGRVFKLLFHVLYLALKALVVLLLLIIPIPIRLKPEITNPYKKNQVTQVEKVKPG